MQAEDSHVECEEQGDDGCEYWDFQKLLAKRKNKTTGEFEYHVRWVSCVEGEGEVDNEEVLVCPSTTSWEPESWLEEEGYGGEVAAFDKNAREAGLENQKKSLVLNHPSQALASRQEAKKRGQAITSKAEFFVKEKNKTAQSADRDWHWTRRWGRPNAVKNPAVWTTFRKERQALVDEMKKGVEVKPTTPQPIDQARLPDRFIRDASAKLLSLHEKKKSGNDAKPYQGDEDTNGGRDQIQRAAEDLSTEAGPKEELANAAKRDRFITAMESAFMGSGHIDPRVLKLLGSAQWDVSKAIEKQEKRFGKCCDDQQEEEESEEGTPKPDGDEKEKKEDESQDEQKRVSSNQQDDGANDSEEDEEENIFMMAPTTFDESADILLVILGFSESSTFFTACSVNRRWRHVARRQRRARTLVRNMCDGLQMCFSRNGMIPIALASAATPVAMLHHLYTQTTKELADPNYKGQNGGDLVPLYDLFQTEEKEIKEGTVQCKPGYSRYSRPTYEVVAAKEAQSWSSATLLDHSVPAKTDKNGVICISIGRLPTATSAHKIDEVENDGRDSLGYTIHRELESGWKSRGVRYSHGFTGMAVPVLYIKLQEAGCSHPRISTVEIRECKDRLSKAARSQWRSEAFGSSNLSLSPQMDRKDLAASLHQLWRSFLLSLPGPRVLWRSFSTTAVLDRGDKFQLLPHGRSSKSTDKEWPLLSHDQIVQALQDNTMSLPGLSPEQKEVLTKLGVRC